MKNRIITGSILAITFVLSITLLPAFILGVFFTILFVYAFIEWLSITGSNNFTKIIYLSLFILLIFSSIDISRELFHSLINYALVFWILVASIIVLNSSTLKVVFVKLAPVFGLISL